MTLHDVKTSQHSLTHRGHVKVIQPLFSSPVQPCVLQLKCTEVFGAAALTAATSLSNLCSKEEEEEVSQCSVATFGGHMVQKGAQTNFNLTLHMLPVIRWKVKTRVRFLFFSSPSGEILIKKNWASQRKRELLAVSQNYSKDVSSSSFKDTSCNFCLLFCRLYLWECEHAKNDTPRTSKTLVRPPEGFINTNCVLNTLHAYAQAL